jgi:hypothetical protein
MQRWVEDPFSKAERIAGGDFYGPSYLIAVHLAVHEKTEHNQLRHANHKCGILRRHTPVYLVSRCMAIFILLLGETTLCFAAILGYDKWMRWGRREIDHRVDTAYGLWWFSRTRV